jgi:hypothetical protein
VFEVCRAGVCLASNSAILTAGPNTLQMLGKGLQVEFAFELKTAAVMTAASQVLKISNVFK